MAKIALDWESINDWYHKVDGALYGLKNGGSNETAIGILEELKTSILEKRGV